MVRLWDVATGRKLATFPRRYPASIFSLAYSPDGTMAALGNYDGEIELRDLATGLGRVPIAGHTKAVASLVFAPTGVSWPRGVTTVA